VFTGPGHPALITPKERLMKIMRLATLACLTAGLVICSPSSGGTTPAPKTKTNKDKLIGTWVVTKSAEAPPEATVEFTKDGKLILSAKVDGKDMKMEGTYTVDGDKITSVTKVSGGKELKETVTIIKLTNTELVTKDEKGKTDEFKRKK
jgi:uncharacterized protein (TIGR03066 family)